MPNKVIKAFFRTIVESVINSKGDLGKFDEAL